ncbi:hypothetical protein LQF12_00840 [Ruania suaedae]|uniref:hypothetical protein n=1 Tax=Ruania suaedae TaxID=2897774 RepID=UPI001E4F8B6A|nr:hypothetical protein [Ruania suaedae]UFU03192.1 hypothetical protein LQF12_00840 [Ruania suaedae]
MAEQTHGQPAGQDVRHAEGRPATPDSHWYEHPLGGVAQLATAVRSTLLPVAAGCGVMFLAIVVLGLAMEEGALIEDYELRQGLDAWARMAVGIVTAAAAAAGLLAGVADAAMHLAGARGLARAGESEDATDRVPVPAQWRLLEGTVGSALVVFLAWTLGLGAIAVVMFVVVAFEDADDPVGWIAAGVAVGVCLASWSGIVLVRRVLRPAHARAAERARAAWPRPARDRAFGRAARITGAGGTQQQRSGPERVGHWLSRVGGVLLAVVGALVMLGISVRQPGGRFGEPVSYDEGVESAMDGLFTVIVVLGVCGGLLTLGGLLVGALARTAERATVHAAVADPLADRPDPALLARHSAPTSLDVAELLAGLGGAGLVAAISAGIVAAGGSVPFAGTEPLVRLVLWCSLAALGFALVAQLLERVLGRGSRNRVLRRWPVRVPAKPKAGR